MIKQSMKRAWNAYTSTAIGWDNLNPLTASGSDEMGISSTIIDSLDTLFIMGMKKELKNARKWLEKEYIQSMSSSAFEITIRGVGGFVSIYEMTQDPFYLECASGILKVLEAIYETKTGLPYSLINLKTREVFDHPWAYRSTILSEAGSVQLESAACSRYSRDTGHLNKSMKVFYKLLSYGALPPTTIYYQNGIPASDSVSMDAFGDSFYEYILKLAVYDRQQYGHLFKRFDEAIEQALDQIAFMHLETRHLYFAHTQSRTIRHSQTHLSFFLPGVLFLASKYSESPKSEEYLKLARALLESSQYLHDIQPTGLAGDEVLFTSTAPGVLWTDSTYKLRPEHVESLFYSWRIDRNIRSKANAWKIYEAIEKYCSVQGAYASVSNTDMKFVTYSNLMESFFLSETLKYLYLMFSDDSFYSLDDYVFTTEAHPIRRVK